jgi:hypothetical protein
MRFSWLSHAATGCAGIVVGAVVVSFWGQHSPTSQVSVPRSASDEPVATPPLGAAASDGRIRQIIREELARHDAVAVAAAPVGPSPAISPPPVAADVAAQMARANAMLDAATVRLSWTAEDSEEFRSVIAALPAAERQELMFKFAQAVNERGMRLETGGAPF